MRLTKPGEVIFSNVLIDPNLIPHWLGMGKELPISGINHSGQWQKGKTDDNGNEITASHKNARYCLNIPDLGNCDPLLDFPEGVPVSAIIHGGRDSDTWVPAVVNTNLQKHTYTTTLAQHLCRPYL